MRKAIKIQAKKFFDKHDSQDKCYVAEDGQVFDGDNRHGAVVHRQKHGVRYHEVTRSQVKNTKVPKDFKFDSQKSSDDQADQLQQKLEKSQKRVNELEKENKKLKKELENSKKSKNSKKPKNSKK